ncbi:hypothetical protein D9O36_07035 [Zobellia amurskyensis]|uniref:DUF2383 domain-containing protein n=1 Tax=Zobellia amurskyensis TaxID=248905 RepID=A0A7X2ZSJ0_9FLAO|nr:hypothetical protein [Zobellia amurskyensis]MUH35588.1 hypothetical protein [Zobellia amurskyensis]
MERERTAWENALNELVAETHACERTYGTLIQSDRYPTWLAYFKKRHFEEVDFEKILTNEYHAVTERKVARPAEVDKPIFESLETQLLEKNLSDKEVNVLITAKEQALVLQYQNLLAFGSLPKTTSALLQSQAEDLNSTLQSLRMDYNTKYKTGPIKSQ